MHLTDTHTHLHFDQYQEDLAEVVRRAIDENVQRILTLGTDLDSGRETVKIANNYKQVFAAVGIHPTEVYQSRQQDVDEILTLAKNEERVVAIGEIGMDLHWKEVSLEAQLPVFERMIEIAHRLKVPVVIHNREAHQEMREFFQVHEINSLKGVMHSFSGNSDDAEFYLDKGLHISFTGVLTFKNFKQQEVVRSIPLDRILLETDSPFLTPAPFRGKRNEPSYVKYIAMALAQIHDMNLEDVVQKTWENANTLFQWSI